MLIPRPFYSIASVTVLKPLRYHLERRALIYMQLRGNLAHPSL